MTKLRKPREFWIHPSPLHKVSDACWEEPIVSHVFIHAIEVLSETPSKDAEEAAENWVKNYGMTVRFPAIAYHSQRLAHLAGQRIGEARRTREICDWLDTDEAWLIYSDDKPSHQGWKREIENKFLCIKKSV